MAGNDIKDIIKRIDMLERKFEKRFKSLETDIGSNSSSINRSTDDLILRIRDVHKKAEKRSDEALDHSADIREKLYKFMETTTSKLQDLETKIRKLED